MDLDFYEHIEAYISGSLSNDLKEKMEKAIQADPSLKLAIENYPDAQLISEGLLELDVLETLEKLESEDPQNKNEMTEDKKGKSKLPMIIVAILAIASLGIWFVLPSNSDAPADKQSEFASTYERPVNENATKSAGTSSDALEEGKRLFDLNKFGEAAVILEQAALVNLDPDKRADIHFWLAHCHFQLEDYSKARLNAAISGHEDTDKLMKQIKAALQNPDRNK